MRFRYRRTPPPVTLVVAYDGETAASIDLDTLARAVQASGEGVVMVATFGEKHSYTSVYAVRKG